MIEVRSSTLSLHVLLSKTRICASYHKFEMYRIFLSFLQAIVTNQSSKRIRKNCPKQYFCVLIDFPSFYASSFEMFTELHGQNEEFGLIFIQVLIYNQKTCFFGGEADFTSRLMLASRENTLFQLVNSFSLSLWGVRGRVIAHWKGKIVLYNLLSISSFNEVFSYQ